MGGPMAEQTPEPRSDRETQPVPEWARSLTRVMDDAVRVPGTKLGIGLDSIVGFLLPGVGDAMTGVASLALLIVAVRSGVPRVVILRMLMNIAIDALVGAVPFLGDLFDVAWKANRMNLELIEQYEGDPEKQPSALDYLLVGVGVLLVALAIILPLLVLVAVGGSLGGLFGGP